MKRVLLDHCVPKPLRRWIPIFLACVLVAASADGAGDSSEPDFSAKSLAFCRVSLGKKVGDGQCTTMVAQALAAAGAAGISGHFPGAGDYVWGRPVAVIEADGNGLATSRQLSAVQPGDVVQFRNTRFQGKIHDGGNGTYWVESQHHSALVGAINVRRGTLTIFEQNSARVSYVVHHTLYLADLKRGWLRIYRPQPLALRKAPESLASVAAK